MVLSEENPPFPPLYIRPHTCLSSMPPFHYILLTHISNFRDVVPITYQRSSDFLYLTAFLYTPLLFSFFFFFFFFCRCVILGIEYHHIMATDLVFFLSCFFCALCFSLYTKL
ncbi:hypothetical protein V8C42DRAFT_218372 [Trichoderma barbatum]